MVVFLSITERPGGIYLWTPGGAPVGFASVADFQAIAAGLGKSTDDVHAVSEAMFNALVAAASVSPVVNVAAPVVNVPPIVWPKYIPQ